MPIKNRALIDSPVWKDRTLLQNPPYYEFRFDYLMDYMKWVTDYTEGILRGKGFDVERLIGEECTEDNIKRALKDFDPILHIHASHGCCVPPETLICANEELRPISELSKGEMVLTHLGRYRPIVNVFKRRYVGDLVRIKAKYSPPMMLMMLTPDHPVLVETPKGPMWLPAGKIKAGDDIIWVLPEEGVKGELGSLLVVPYVTLEVMDIERVPYDGYVYNLEVEEDNSYSLFGATVHNCNGLTGAPYKPYAPPGMPEQPSFVIRSQPYGWCPTRAPLEAPNGACPFIDVPNVDMDIGRICVDMACITNRWLAEARIEAGALATIAYDDLLMAILGQKREEWWIEEICMREAYNGPVMALAEGKTVGEALSFAFDYYNKLADRIEREHPEDASSIVPALLGNRDILASRGLQSATAGEPRLTEVSPLSMAMAMGVPILASYLAYKGIRGIKHGK